MENPRRVLGVLAGGDIDANRLRKWAESADHVFAADAGADLLLNAGFTPDIVVGDMDSISKESLAAAKQAVVMSDQDTTDCDKLLAVIKNDGHIAVTLIGAEGDLPDHVLATLHSSAQSTLDVRLAYRRGVGWIVKPETPRVIKTMPGRRASLLALEPSFGVHFSGVKWSLAGATLSLTDGTSISNRTDSQEVRVSLNTGAALLFLEVPEDELPIW